MTNRAKLTKGYVDRLKPGSKDEFHWDTELKGFGLRLSAGGKISFIVQGRVKGSEKEARLTIGSYGVFSPDQARDVAREHLRSMRLGVDPRDVRRQDEAAKVTLRQVADAYFARPGMLKESTKTEMERHVDKVFEAWKDKPIAGITPAECRKRYEELATKGLRGKGPAPTQAAIAMVTLRTLINFTINEYKQLDGKPIIEHNPVAVLKKDLRPSPPRTRHIDRRSIGKFWKLLTEARRIPKNRDAEAGIDLVMFLLLTGARRNEGAALTWDRVHINDDDPTDCWWHIPDPKNRNPVWLPLSSQATAVLKSRKPVKDNPYVFASRSKAGHIMDARAPLEQLSKKIGMERLSAHDLRRTFVTTGVKACRLDLAKLELLTNHVPQGITARHYLSTSDLRDFHGEVQAIGDWIESEARVAEAQASGANVVPLHVGAA
jgi:integrase